MGGRRGRHGDRAVNLLTADELEAQLRDIGARRYHRLHPFHRLLHGGECTKGQVQAWALNRYYYQAMIPIKDASLIARCEDPRDAPRMAQPPGRSRRQQRGRRRHRALAQAHRRARSRPRLCNVAARSVAGTRFAVDAYVHFVRDKTLLEAIASSLTELFSPVIISERMEGMLKNYDFRHRGNARLFREAPAASRTRCAVSRSTMSSGSPQTAEQQPACWPRSNSNAACCGRCSMRSIMPMLHRSRYRPALSCRRRIMNEPALARSADARPRLPRGVRLVTMKRKAAGCCWPRSACSRPTRSRPRF